MHTHGLWSTFNQHSQTHLYNHIDGVLAATDGSLKSPDRLGGGIAYRTNDGDSHGFSLLGLYTSLAAEAGALLQLLLESPLDTPLTVLVDSLALLQNIQRNASKEASIDLRHHDHYYILEPLLQQLYLRTAPTHFVKIKSHAGSTLNEAADVYANDGASMDPEGDFAEQPPILSYWTYATSTTKDDLGNSTSTTTQQPLISTAQRDKTWKQQAHLQQRQRINLNPNTTTAYLGRQDAGRRHLRRALTSTSHGMTPAKAKQAMQALCGTFPTNHKLSLMRKIPNPDCDFCPGTAEHMCHWQCLCPQYDDARTAAHNRIWSSLYSHIKRHADTKWQLTAETPMLNTHLRVRPEYHRWTPDGMAYDTTLDILYLLEFTRCFDDRKHDSVLQALERKDIKYDDLAQDLKRRNQDIKDARVLTFAIGYISTTHETRMLQSIAFFGLTPLQATKTLQEAITCTLAEFGTMARTRTAAIALLKKTTSTNRRKTPTGARRRRRTTDPKKKKKRRWQHKGTAKR